MNYILLLIPLFSALIGWLVIKLFFWLLFHPIRPKNVLGIRFQGILVHNQESLAERLGRLAAMEFQSMNLEEKISDPAGMQKVMPMIEEHVEDFLRVKLKAEIPMIGMLVGDKMISGFKKVFMREIETLLPQVMKKFAGNLQEEIQIGNKVRDKINGISLVQLEKDILRNGAKELTRIYFFAALIGFLAGLIELGILLIAR